MPTGPQRYPGADQTHRYQTAYGGDEMEVNVVVLHTTEGRTLPDYGGGASAPTLTAVPDLAAKKLKWYQHFDIDRSARALVNAPGGVETNTLNVCQVELVGTCDPATHTKWASSSHVFWPSAPEWALAELAKFLRWMHDEHGVPLTGPGVWLPYPKSYGNSSARMSFAAWEAFKGVCGHQHVPENSHGDPGAIDFAKLISLAKGLDSEPTVPVTTPAKPTAPRYEPFPGTSFFRTGRRSPIIAAMHKRLVAEGCNRYASQANADTWGSGDVRSYAAWQRKLGYAGSDANGIPGPTSWGKLKVPNV